MKRTAVLLGAWLLLAGTVRAADTETAPMPQTTAPEPSAAVAPPTPETHPVVSGTCCGSCCSGRCWGCGRVQRVWNWLTWRPYHCYWSGCYHMTPEPATPELYTFFIDCQRSYPCSHLALPLYIGMDLPLARDRCCEVNYGHNPGGDCGCGSH